MRGIKFPLGYKFENGEVHIVEENAKIVRRIFEDRINGVTPEGVEYMCKAMEDRITDEKLRIAYNLLLLGTVSKEDIAKVTKLPVERVYKLEEEMKSVTA